MREFQGHRSWNAWNVALWIDNDERFYDVVNNAYNKAISEGCTKEKAINKAISRFMCAYGDKKTPDGGKFTRLAVKLAINDLYE